MKRLNDKLEVDAEGKTYLPIRVLLAMNSWTQNDVKFDDALISKCKELEIDDACISFDKDGNPINEGIPHTCVNCLNLKTYDMKYFCKGHKEDVQLPHWGCICNKFIINE